MRRIVWLNGAFGVGKSTTALHMLALDPTWHLFDPEWVGYMLRANLHGFEEADFQDYPAWRTLVPRVAHEVATHTGRDLLAVQTVLNRDHWRQLRSGLSALGLRSVHVLLDAEPEAIRMRIDGDTVDAGAAAWRHGHLPEFGSSRQWMRDDADIVVDTTVLTAEETAAVVLGRVS